MKIGTRNKCKQIKEVREHHIKGYLGENVNITLPYCRSCDRLAHEQAKKQGNCFLTSKEVSRLSKKSTHNRNTTRKSILRERVDKNVTLNIEIYHWKNTQHLTIQSWFTANGGKKLIYVEV
jgi:hypothetical protein